MLGTWIDGKELNAATSIASVTRLVDWRSYNADFEVEGELVGQAHIAQDVGEAFGHCTITGQEFRADIGVAGTHTHKGRLHAFVIHALVLIHRVKQVRVVVHDEIAVLIESLATLHQAVVAPHAGVSIGRCAVVIAHFCNLVRQREVFVPSPSVLGIFQPQLIKDILVVEPVFDVGAAGNAVVRTVVLDEFGVLSEQTFHVHIKPVNQFIKIVCKSVFNTLSRRRFGDDPEVHFTAAHGDDV